MNIMLKTMIAILIFCASQLALGQGGRPDSWATPLEVSGVANLHKVSSFIYRSAQPTHEGIKNLEKEIGIKTVINLRAFHSDANEIKGTGLLNKELSVKTWRIEDEDIINLLNILKKSENGPFLIHCQHGADRTGIMVAMYRIVEQGWTKDEAIKEMMEGGYGFHSIWSNIIDYVHNVDVEKIKKAQ
ncbi:MAG: tyrosine-protein phosphatase [Candidatus Competibacteraceae bacterium]